MMESPWAAFLWGCAAGVFNGGLTRWALKRTLASSDAVFYSVFIGGILGRLCFLAAAVWLLRNEKYIIVIPFIAGLLAAQFFFEVVPLKRDGIKRNT
ncbi:MAG TPA: hypothetical protein DCZ92_12840 [Elusimicrobia bacterium]|nr:hypothetical protein [Elusimicrobiota bacterium]